MTCLYCKEWIISEIIEKKNKRIKKFCKIIKRNIDKTFDCKKFIPSKYFYCNKNNFRIQMKQCIARQSISKNRKHKKYKYYTDCKKCSQGKNIIFWTNNHNENNFKLKRRNIFKLKRRK